MGYYSKRYLSCAKVTGLLLLPLLLAFGCSSPGENPVSGRKNSMIIHLVNDPEGLNPVNSVGSDATNIHNLIFDHLIALDYETLMLVPRLAKSMPEVSEDKLFFTFHLRDDLKFSDGTPLTSADVVFSFKALMNPFVDSAPKRAELHNFIDCTAPDEKTVVFHLENSGPFNLNRLAINFFVLPKHIYDPQNLSDTYTGLDASTAMRNPEWVSAEKRAALETFATAFEDENFQREVGFVVGSGRYRFDGWSTGQSIRLVRNENYWNQGADEAFSVQNLDTIVYKTIPDAQTALQALKSGEIDFSDHFEPDQFENKLSGPESERIFARKNVPYPYYEYVGWNANIRGNGNKQFFAEREVRQAMSHLINVDEIIENIVNGSGQPITSMVYHERPEYNKALKPIRYDEEKALKLLAAAGWQDTNGDGLLDKDFQGEQVNFSFTMYYKRGNELRRRIARSIQDKFRKAGIEVKVADLDWTVMLDRLKKHELEAWLGAWVYDSDEQDLYSLFHSSQSLNDGYNWCSYVNSKADSVMEQITVEWDQEKRFALHREIQAILYEDQPYTLLYANAARIAWNKRLTNDAWYGQRPCYDPPRFRLVSNH
jgi:peptide/nickel transport system substrate-binding protein